MTKSSKRIFTVLLCALLILIAGIISACANGKVKLTFMDGDTEYAVIEEKAGAEITPPADPEKEGYRFSGWYLDANFSGEAQTIPTQMPEESKTYYARWTEKVPAKLTLDAGDEGTLAQTEVQVSVGDNVLDALKNITPTVKTDFVGILTFGGWFDGATQVTSDTLVPASGMQLKAKYKISYTVSLYVELEGTDGQYPSNATVTRGTSWYKEPFQYEIDKATYPHFVFDTTWEHFNDHTASLEIETSAFVIYLKHERVTVGYDANTSASDTERPSAVTGSVSGQEAVYGSEVTLAANGFVPQGTFRFAGWAVTRNGAAEYQPGDKITVSENTMLYAVWDRGYRDRFGGSDVIYFPKAESGVAVLVRGDKEFKGAIASDGASFTFTIKEGSAEDTLSGKVDGNTFAYLRTNIEGTYTLYDSSLQINEETLEPSSGTYEPYGLTDSVTLTIDGYTATLQIDDSSVSGIYGYDRELQLYYMEANDSTLYFSLGKYEPDTTAPDGPTAADAGDNLVDVFFIVEVEEMGIYTEMQWLNAEGNIASGQFVAMLSGNGQLYLQDMYTGEMYYGYYANQETFTSTDPSVNLSIAFYTAVYFTGDDEPVPFEFYTIDDFLCRRIESAIGEFSGKIGGKQATIKLNGYNAFDREYLSASSAEPTNYYIEIDGTKYDIMMDCNVRLTVTGTEGKPFTVLTFSLPKKVTDASAKDDETVNYSVRLYKDGNDLKFEEFHDGEYYWLLYQEDEEDSGNSGDSMLPLVLVLSNEDYIGDESVENADKASIYVLDMGTGEYTQVSKGYVTQEEGGYGFRTYMSLDEELLDLNDVFFREMFKFRIYDAAEGRPRASYLVYEIDYEPLYQTVPDKEGNELLIYLNVQEQKGIGSFYKAKGGEVTEGSLLLIDETTMPLGQDKTTQIRTETFSFTEADGTLRYFDVEVRVDTATSVPTIHSFEEFNGPQAIDILTFYNFYTTTNGLQIMPALSYNSDTQKWEYNIYAENDGVTSSSRSGTVDGALTKADDETSLGYDIYTFTADQNNYGITTFNFSPWELEQSSGIFHMMGLSGTEESLTSADGDEVELDGYAGAVLTTADGTEYIGSYFERDWELALDIERPAIYFIAETGEEFLLIRTDDGFYLVDDLFNAFYEGVFDASKDLSSAESMPYGDIAIGCLGDGTAVIYEWDDTAEKYVRVGEGTYTYTLLYEDLALIDFTLNFTSAASIGARTISFTAFNTTMSYGTIEIPVLALVSEEELASEVLYSEDDWSILVFPKATEVGGEEVSAIYYDAVGYAYSGYFAKIDATHGIFYFSSSELPDGVAMEDTFIYFTYNTAKGTFTRDTTATKTEYTDPGTSGGKITIYSIGPEVISFDIDLPDYTDSKNAAFKAEHIDGANFMAATQSDPYTILYEGTDELFYWIEFASFAENKFSVNVVLLATMFGSSSESLIFFQYWAGSSTTFVNGAGNVFENCEKYQLVDMVYENATIAAMESREMADTFCMTVGKDGNGKEYGAYLYQDSYSSNHSEYLAIVFRPVFDNDHHLIVDAALSEELGFTLATYPQTAGAAQGGAATQAAQAENDEQFLVLYDDYGYVRYIASVSSASGGTLDYAEIISNPSGTWTIKVKDMEADTTSNEVTVIFEYDGRMFVAEKVADLAEGTYTGTEGSISVTSDNKVTFSFSSIQDSGGNAFTSIVVDRNQVTYNFLAKGKKPVYVAQFTANDNHIYNIEFTITTGSENKFELYDISVNASLDFVGPEGRDKMHLDLTRVWHKGFSGDEKGTVVNAQLYQYRAPKSRLKDALNCLLFNCDTTKNTISYIYYDEDTGAYTEFEITCTVDEKGIVTGIKSITEKKQTDYSGWAALALPDTTEEWAVCIAYGIGDAGKVELRVLAFGYAYPYTAVFMANVTIAEVEGKDYTYTVKVNGEAKYTLTFTVTATGTTVSNITFTVTEADAG